MIVFSSSSLDTSNHAGVFATVGGRDREEPFFLLCIFAIFQSSLSFIKAKV
jgi:hypothetical protein